MQTCPATSSVTKGLFKNKTLAELRGIRDTYEQEIRCRDEKLAYIRALIAEREKLTPGKKVLIAGKDGSQFEGDTYWLVLDVISHGPMWLPVASLTTGAVKHVDTSAWTVQVAENHIFL